MPKRARRVSEYGIGRTLPAFPKGSGRVQAERRLKQAERRLEWLGLRERVMMRDGWRCRRCGRRPTPGNGLDPHHVVPRSLGGSDHSDNVVALCRSCHSWVDLGDNWKALAAVVQREA